ncbi:MAG: hypothetical protein Q8M07_24240 [Prosthecobacter sp.]|nr:hypothetical protein [Prosthecobacter sp.]
MRSLFRVAAVLSSIGLLIICVWFAQKKSNPVIMPGSKSISHLIAPADSQKASHTVMPGSKSGTLIMPWETSRYADKPEIGFWRFGIHLDAFPSE